MKTAKQLYPDAWEQEQGKEGYFWRVSDYQPIIDAIGTVLLQVDDNDYQGDSRILYEKDGKYGFLIFGWGSCSGCDSLQACNNMAEVQNLLDQLLNDVAWFNSLEELKTFFRDRDWELQYSYNADETKDFIQKVLEYQLP